MKKILSIILLVLLSVLNLVACGGSSTNTPQQNPDTPPTGTPDGNTTAPPPATAEPQPSDDAGYIKVLYNSIYWRERMDGSVIVRSEEELRSFSKQLMPTSTNGSNEEYISKLTGEQYDEEFFKDHLLVFITVGESSGSNRHELTSVTEDNGVLTININRLMPEIGTADMAGWLITIELSNDYSADKTEVIFTDVQRSS